jgi:hypothetical protein
MSQATTFLGLSLELLEDLAMRIFLIKGQARAILQYFPAFASHEVCEARDTDTAPLAYGNILSSQAWASP